MFLEQAFGEIFRSLIFIGIMLLVFPIVYFFGLRFLVKFLNPLKIWQGILTSIVFNLVILVVFVLITIARDIEFGSDFPIYILGVFVFSVFEGIFISLFLRAE